MGKKILLSEDIDNVGKDYLKEHGYEIKMASDTSEGVLAKEVVDCDGLLVRMADITEKVIRAGKKLKVISKFGVGVDNIDVEAATSAGIHITNSADSNKNTVAEYTIGFIMELAKNLLLYDKELRKGNFQIRKVFGTDLKGKVLGIIGIGSIGQLVASKASKGLGMKVIGFKRHIDTSNPIEGIKLTEDMDYVISNSDFLSLHVPLTKHTKKLIGKRELSLMKPSAFLINTARGEVVDNEALVEALVKKTIAGAAVDVFEGEVPSDDNPLFALDNVIVTPHTGAHTVEAVKRMSLHPAIGIHEVLSGKIPTWPVNQL